jgi:ABC-type transport system involved in multi-copper enzyme maturation permease subunit
MLLGEPRILQINVWEVLQTFSGLAPYHTRLTVTNFINSLGSVPSGKPPYGNSNLTVIYILVIILVSVTVMSKTDKAHADQILSVHLVLWVGFIVYALMLLFSYIYYFQPYDGSNAPSLARYLGSYLLAWILMILGSFSVGSAEKTEIQSPPRPYAILLAGLFLFTFLKIPLQAYMHLPTLSVRARTLAQASYLRAIDTPLPADSKIYDIWQVGPGNYGEEHRVMRYLLCPLPSNYMGWRLGPPYNKADIYNINFSPQEWLEFLHKYSYTHVLVSTGDQSFWNHYGSLFDSTSSQDKPHLYKVESNGLVRVK